jgi:hypothetical protein
LDVDLPLHFNLGQNYPNPFNPTTTISFSIKETGKISLRIYDTLGNLVDEIFNETKQPGEYKINYNASKLSSGIYLYELQNSKFTSVKKMILLK